MEQLYDKLLKYSQEDYYPYHMPGHKRQPMTHVLRHTGALDITEIDGFDNLHHCQGILKEAQAHAARVYGADATYYLVNGSTGGILSAVSAAVPPKGHILMARNCHKSAYHAAYLRKLHISYLMPEMLEADGICKALTPEQVEQALAANTETGAVLIVSPSYEGIIADIAGIAEAVHKYGRILIVDEAHGAHLGFHPEWPENSNRQGADIVIQSLHKTLPSLTQTALLHVNGSRVDRDRLQRFWGIYQSSSPSYVMMAGMGEAVTLMEKDGHRLCGQFLVYWKKMVHDLEACQNLHVLTSEATGQIHDIGKLVVSTAGTGLSGQELYDILLEKYHLQTEMAAATYVLAMFTVADSEEGYRRLTEAVLKIDAEMSKEKNMQKDSRPENKIQGMDALNFPMADGAPRQELELGDAWDGEKETVKLEDAAGRTAGEFISLYPPGSPVLVPGECIEEQTIKCIREYIRQKLPVHGVTEKNNAVYVSVVK